jgi:hypothetical protein
MDNGDKIDWTLASAILEYLADAGGLVYVPIMRKYIVADDTVFQGTLDRLLELGQVERRGTFYRIRSV